MKKHLFAKIAACVLAVAMLGGCASGGSKASGVETVKQVKTPDNGVIAYVPLDDRPVNTDRVAYLAKSLGYRISMPETSLYHTCLDKQDANPGGLRYGNRAALLEWVEHQEQSGCHRYILSLDQLLSGGLVNSRSMTAQSVKLSDGTVLTETQVIDRLLNTLGSDPDNQVYLLDTVMRLAPTVGYDGFDLTGYDALREYGMEARPALSGSDLTVENIVKNYALDKRGKSLSLPAGSPLTAGDIQAYLISRERKLRLTDHALSAAGSMKNIHFLIGVDDSASTASVQTSEIAYLKQAVNGRGALLSGADEDGMLAVCKLYEDTVFTGKLPSVQVRYFGGSEQSASSDYDHQPMTEIVNAHLDYLGLKAAPSSRELQILVLTAPKDSAQAEATCQKLVRLLQKNQADGIPCILLDAAKNGYGSTFQKLLVKKVRLGELLGYAGFYDLANVTGIALSNGVARWLCLTQQKQSSEAQNIAFLRTLSDSLIKDISWKNDAKNQAAAYIRTELKGNPDNFCDPKIDPKKVREHLESLMPAATAGVLQNFSKTNVITALSPTQTRGCGGIYLTDFSFPWQRVFELRLKLTVAPMTDNHINIFGFFYS
jgi:hypothetical protein